MEHRDWTKVILKALLISVLTLIACMGCVLPAAPTAPPEEKAAEAPPPTKDLDAVTITYWHAMGDAEAEALQEVIAMFEAGHPGMAIQMTRYASEDLKSALLASLAGGKALDTARLDIVWMPEFAEELEALVPLDGAMPDLEEIAAKSLPSPLATNFWQGRCYGLPQDTSTQVLLWNKGLFQEAGIEEPPATLDLFKEVACELSKGEEQYGYAMSGTSFWAIAPVFYANGGKVVDQDVTTAEGYINGRQSVEAFQMLVDMYNEGCLSPNLLDGGLGTLEGHATGLYAMIMDGPWMVDASEADFPEAKLNFAPIPKRAGGGISTGVFGQNLEDGIAVAVPVPEGETSSVLGGHNVVVFNTSEYQKEAIEWVRFLLSEEAQLTMAKRGMIPTLGTVTGNASLPEHFGVFLEQLTTAQARVPHPKWGAMDGAISKAFQRMLRGEQTVQEALDQAAQEIDALLGQ